MEVNTSNTSPHQKEDDNTAKKRHTDLYREEPKNPRKKFAVMLPLPPSVNHMYIHKRNGSKILNRDAEDYVRKSRALINEAMEEQSWEVQGENVWYYADLYFFMESRRIKDSHNMLKLLLDVMQGIAFGNDYYVMPRIHAVELDEQFPHVEVVIRPQTHKERVKVLADRYFA